MKYHTMTHGEKKSKPLADQIVARDLPHKADTIAHTLELERQIKALELLETARTARERMLESPLDTRVIANDIAYIKGDISEIKQSIRDMVNSFITKNEFAPVRNITYGLVATILVGIVGTILRVILKV